MIRVAVGIIKRDNQILVCERPIGKPYAGYWEFPGGKIEAEESGIEALERELFEELGIQVNQAEFWFDHRHVYPDKTVFLEMWLIKEFLGEPFGKENQAINWASFSQMLVMPLLEGNLPILEKIKSLF